MGTTTNKDDCTDCHGTGLGPKNVLCPTCGGTPSAAERKRVADEAKAEATAE